LSIFESIKLYLRELLSHSKYGLSPLMIGMAIISGTS
jgi:hypothetical protein